MKNTALGVLGAFFLITGYWGITAQKTVEVSSPTNKLRVAINTEGSLTYSIKSAEIQVLNTSSLGLTIDSVDLGSGVKIDGKLLKTKINERYSTLGNHATAVNKANEVAIPLLASGKNYMLFVRVYDDGVAVRYSIPANAKRINGESTTWNLPDATQKVAWSGFHQSYEDVASVTPLQGVPQNKTLMGPITYELSGRYVSFSEADCETFSDMAFIRNGATFKVEFPFSKKGWDIVKRSDNGPKILNGTYRGYSVSPWRTTIIASSLTELINSDLLMNLCPAPAKDMDFSWVKPGRSLWQWWSVGSPRYEDQKNWYDAAAKLKWEYYLVDDGWRNWRQGEKDQWQLLAEVVAYGKTVGVKSIVWVDSKEMREGAKRRAYLEKVKALGADGIKIDFIPDATSDIIQWYMGTMQDCAELKLLLNFHGSVKPTGLTRTYPNDITREAVRGNEYQMTRYRRVAPYELDVCLPFARYMAGAADYTPVILNPKELASKNFTWAHEFAQAIVFLSPITHFTDQYSFYLESPMFDLFQEIPTVWDETKVLSCTSMGEVVAYARRSGTTWWIGVMNGATEREVRIPLDFLRKKANATLVYDNPATNVSIDRQNKVVTAKEVLTLKLAPGGGFVARLKQ